MSPFSLLAVGIAAVGTVVSAAFALRNGRRARLIAETPPAKAGSLELGPAKITGQVVALDEALEGPLSGRPCVYYRFQVEEKRQRAHGPHGGGSYWKTVIDDVRCVDCGLEDETGIAAVRLREAELLVTPDAQTRSGLFNDAPPQLEQLLRERYGRSSVGWFFNKSMRYTESRVEPGDTLFVVGSVEPTPGGNACFVKGGGLFLVTDKSEADLAAHYRGYALLCWALAAAVPILAAVLLYLFL